MKRSISTAIASLAFIALSAALSDAQTVTSNWMRGHQKFTVLEEKSHAGTAERPLGPIEITRNPGREAQIQFGAAQQNATMHAAVASDGTLRTAQPDIANAYNAAVLVSRVLHGEVKGTEHWRMPFTFHPREYPAVTMPMEISVVGISDRPNLVHVVGEGRVPGRATLSGEKKAVYLQGRFDIKFENGDLVASATSITSVTMNQNEIADTLSWSLYAPGQLIPGFPKR